MATSKWNTFTVEQKQRYTEQERDRRRKRAASRTDEQKATLAVQRKEAARRRREQKHDSVLDAERQYYKIGKGYFLKWANTIKSRAMKKGIPYDLDADFLREIMPTHCPVLGIPLVRRSSKTDNSPGSPTLDRIFPERGYVRDNVIVVSKRANQIKSDASPDEIRRVADYYDVLCEGLKDL